MFYVLNILNVLNVLKVLNVLNIPNVLNVLKKGDCVTESHGTGLEMPPHLKSRESVKLALSIRLSIHHQNPNLSINESL